MDLDKIASKIGVKTAMDRPKVKQIRSELERAMKNLETSLGMTIKVGSARFDSLTCTFKVEFVERGAGGEVQSKESINFKTYAREFGLDVDDLGKDIVVRGKRFKITGLNPRQYKFPILAVLESTGTTYKLPIEDVLQALGKGANKVQPIVNIPNPTTPMNLHQHGDIPQNIKEKFMQLSNELSPENLHMDGEISNAQAQKRYRMFMREWHDLERQVGRKVSEDEVWKWVLKR